MKIEEAKLYYEKELEEDFYKKREICNQFENLEQKWIDYSTSIELYIDNHIKYNYYDGRVEINLIKLSQIVNIPLETHKQGGYFYLSNERELAEYIVLLYRRNGFNANYYVYYHEGEYRDESTSNFIRISGWAD